MTQQSLALPDEVVAKVRNVYCGSCSWTDPTLLKARTFYPKAAKTSEDRLRYYASHFPLVEVDSTYYAPPSEENCKRWAERAPAGFLFNFKAYGALTHHPVLVRSLPPELRAQLPSEAQTQSRVYLSALPAPAQEGLWEVHRTALQPLAEQDKLGAVLFQFPYWFTRNAKNQDYLRELKDRLPWRIAVEFRGGGWMDERARGATLGLLQELGYAYVIVDEPQGFKSSTPTVWAQTSELTMLRFHGRNAEMWEAKVKTTAERFNYLYRDEELAPFADKAAELSKSSEQVHVLYNNNYGDYPIRNARQMARLLQERLD
jgi:uncharacterized protein YecE (DUF72 family)